MDADCKVLTWGVDTAVLAVYVSWRNKSRWVEWDQEQQKAKAAGSCPGLIAGGHDGGFLYEMQPHGSRGYAWVLVGREWTWRIARQDTPESEASKPGVMVEVRSETLWRWGLQRCVDRIKAACHRFGADPAAVLPSRIDQCVDILVPESVWSLDILNQAVRRADTDAVYRRKKRLTGITFGAPGAPLRCRIYDKPAEIDAHGGRKAWFFDLWGLPDGVPDGCKVLRVEFQMRREKLKGLGADLIADYWNVQTGIWRYLTGSWLQITTDGDAHKNCRQVLGWWKDVQAGFDPADQESPPAVLEKACRAEADALARQAAGCMVSICALKLVADGCHDESQTLGEQVAILSREFTAILDDDDVMERLVKRVHRFHVERTAREAARAATAGIAESGSGQSQPTRPGSTRPGEWRSELPKHDSGVFLASQNNSLN